MPREYLCQYGSCAETETPITVTVRDKFDGAQVRFCSYEHLRKWAAKQAGRQSFVPRETRAREFDQKEGDDLG